MEIPTNQLIKNIVLPAKHVEIRMVKAVETYLLGSRGSFKTTRGILLYVLEKVYEMPRSTGVAVGISYEHLEKNTLPPLTLSLAELGIFEGDHYVIGKKPPEHWEKPLLGVVNNNYKTAWTWNNGTVIQLISLARKASSNGISAQWGFFDEAKFMNEKDLIDEIFPIFRPNGDHFKNCTGYLSKFFATDKLADPVQIRWLLNKRKHNNPKKIQTVISLQQSLSKLNEDIKTAGIIKKTVLIKEKNEIDKLLHALRSTMVYVAEISAYDVLPIMGEDWLKGLARNMSKYEFEISIENKDPDRPGQSFYPDFDITTHTYESDNDIDTFKPLIISCDYQHSVSPICVAQLTPESLNYVDEIYTLAPAGLQEAIVRFCKIHNNHIKKLVYYVFDHTAIGKRVNADRYYSIVTRILRDNSWAVIELNSGKAPGHYQKYLDTRDWLLNKQPTVRKIKINNRCEKLIISITGAPAKSTRGKTEKDKSMELLSSLDQSETTHFSDAWDMLNHAVLKLNMISSHTEKKSFGFR